MPKPPLRPPADHESADVRVVAPVNAGQQGDTSLISLLGALVGLVFTVLALLAMIFVNFYLAGVLLRRIFELLSA